MRICGLEAVADGKYGVVVGGPAVLMQYAPMRGGFVKSER